MCARRAAQALKVRGQEFLPASFRQFGLGFADRVARIASLCTGSANSLHQTRPASQARFPRAAASRERLLPAGGFRGHIYVRWNSKDAVVARVKRKILVMRRIVARSRRRETLNKSCATEAILAIRGKASPGWVDPNPPQSFTTTPLCLRISDFQRLPIHRTLHHAGRFNIARAWCLLVSLLQMLCCTIST